MRSRLCSRCRRVIPSGQRCNCVEAKRKAEYDKRRPSAGERGYDADWRAVRRQYLAAHPDCSHPGCTAAATEVDHIQSVKDRPDLRLHWSNLRPFVNGTIASGRLGTKPSVCPQKPVRAHGLLT